MNEPETLLNNKKNLSHDRKVLWNGSASATNDQNAWSDEAGFSSNNAGSGPFGEAVLADDKAFLTFVEMFLSFDKDSLTNIERSSINRKPALKGITYPAKTIH